MSSLKRSHKANGFVIRVQNEQNVCMGQASLLPLNDMNVSHHFAKNAFLQKLVQQVL